MNSKVFFILRAILGILVLIFGLNKFFHFMPMSESMMSGDAGAYFSALSTANTMKLVALVEIVSGLALIFNKFGALMAIILMSVSVNAVLFHISLDTSTILPAIVLLLLNIVALIGYKDKYTDLLNG